MVRKSVKITVCTMAAVMAFSGMNITADAAASSSVLPSGGIELTLAKGNKLESLLRASMLKSRWKHQMLRMQKSSARRSPLTQM